tara:strand:+ start:356 stop:532 length:177 start_codon:yes stop_codon:yes gene_type:complete
MLQLVLKTLVVKLTPAPTIGVDPVGHGAQIDVGFVLDAKWQVGAVRKGHPAGSKLAAK